MRHLTCSTLKDSLSFHSEILYLGAIKTGDMGVKALDTHSLDTYIQMEAESKETKYEFYDGFIVAMAGGSPEHGKIAINVGTALSNALRVAKKDCDVYSSDVKIAINKINKRHYPDLSAVCGPVIRDKKEPKAITNPTLIVEVLSESTESKDRGEKFMAYRQLESLKDYVLISQDEALVEVFSRTPDGTWRIQAAIGLDREIELPALDVKLNTSDIYFRLEGIS